VRTIWKYEIPVADEFGVAMQQDAQILCVQVQHGHPCIWAIVDPEAPRVERRLAVRGTGHPLGDVGLYIGTFQVHSGSLVFHLFEAP
jgi:hypothetical protein